MADTFTLEKRRINYPATRKMRALEDRFFEKVAATLGCWRWLGGSTGHGYGVFWIGGRQRGAHVVALELAHGPIPDGLEVDHLCRNKACVNPEHLEAVTHLENVRRGKRRNPHLHRVNNRFAAQESGQ